MASNGSVGCFPPVQSGGRLTRAYHIGLVRPEKRWRGGPISDEELSAYEIAPHGNLYVTPSKTVVIQLRASIDLLDTDTWVYVGLFATTKQLVKEQASSVLRWINKKYGTERDGPYFAALLVD